MNTMTTAELVALLTEMLLVREGMVITPKLADERARNIAVVLAGTTITEASGEQREAA